MSSHKDWIELSIYEIVDPMPWPTFEMLDTGEVVKRVGRVYERRGYAYQLPRLATGRVMKHASITRDTTYVALVSGIGEVARARINA